MQGYIDKNFIVSSSDKLGKGFLAEVHNDKVVLSKKILETMFLEMKDASESEDKAYIGLALRMCLIVTHERIHLIDRENQLKELGFAWPLSSLEAEIRSVTTESQMFNVIKSDAELIKVFNETRPPRNYIMPGLGSSITEEFDNRIQNASLILKQKRKDQFYEFVQQFYPNACSIKTTSNKELEIQLMAILKIVSNENERQKIKEAIAIVTDKEKFKKLLDWY